jgi:outer membrane immunogenic protein
MKGLRAFQLGTAAAIAVVSCAVSAQAADLPSRVLTPIAPVASVPSWTGFYVGVEGGADISTNKYTTTALGTGFLLDPNNTASLGQTSGRVGLYLGYNYQVSSSYVIGLEGDAAYDFGSTKNTTGVPGTVASVGTPDSDSVSAYSKYDASIRGRAGYLITPVILAYATAGVAFRDASYAINCPSGISSWCTAPEYSNIHTLQTGYTVGGGVEGFVAPNLLLRAEYRYSDFGGKDSTYFGTPAAADYFATHTHLSSSTVTVGLAYKFSMPEPGPVVARY